MDESNDKQDAPSHWQDGDAADADAPAFCDDSGRVTLTLDGPPLSLPREVLEELPSPTRPSLPEPTFLDAWSADRLRRSSLPPSVAARASVYPAPPENEGALGAESLPSDESYDDDLLQLVSRARPAQALDVVTEMTERFALGDFSGALRAAELLLGKDPAHTLGHHYARESRSKLEEMYKSRLGPPGKSLVVLVNATEVAWLGLDPQVAALLAQVRPDVDYEALLSQIGMPRLWGLRALVELLDARVIRLV